MGFITISLKLFKPSRAKKNIMENALENYSRAFDYIVAKAFDSLDILEDLSSQKNSQTKISRWCSEHFGREVNNFHVEPFKDSLMIDFATYILGYFALIKRRKQGDKTSVLTGERKEGNFRPIYFCRTSPKRDFALLYDTQRERFYLKLYLLNRKSELKRVQTSKENGLIYIHPDGGSLRATGRAQRFIIVPLAFGKWQEEYLRLAIENPALIKSARLKKMAGLKKNNAEYFMDINIEVDHPKAYPVKNYLSITRGLVEPLNYAIVGENQRLIDAGVLVHKDDLEARNSTQFLFEVAKKIIEKALMNQAAVIVEKLDYRTDYLDYKDKKENIYESAFSKELYRKLVNILGYKLPSKGCGSILELSPLDLFHRCPVCSTCSRKSRFSPELFICTSCATSMEVDKLGSLNLARKLLKYRDSKIQIKSEIQAESIIFTNNILDFSLECKLGRLDYTELVASKLKEIAEGFEIGNISKKKASLLMKIKSNSDLTKLVDIM